MLALRGSTPGGRSGRSIATGVCAAFSLAAGASAQGQNHPPVLGAIEDQTIAEGEHLSFVVTGTDEDFDPVRFEATGIPWGATFDPVTVTFDWTPGFDQAGRYELSFLLRDARGAESEPVTVAITVTNTNRPPSIAPVPDIVIEEGEKAFFAIHVTEPDGDPVRVSFTSMPALPQAARSFDADRLIFRYEAPPASAGSYRLTITVIDAAVPSASASISLSLTIVPCPALDIVTPSRIVGREGTEVRVEVLVSAPEGGTVSLAADVAAIADLGATFDPAKGELVWPMPVEGTYPITLSVFRGCGGRSDKVVEIVILSAGSGCRATGASSDGFGPEVIALFALLLVACARLRSIAAAPRCPGRDGSDGRGRSRPRRAGTGTAGGDRSRS